MFPPRAPFFSEHGARGAQEEAGNLPVSRNPSPGRQTSCRPPPWDWSLEQDGALALDRHDLWDEPAQRAQFATSHAPPHEGLLKDHRGFVSVPAMAQAPGQALPARERRAAAQSARRRRRLAGLVVLAVVALITLPLTAFGSGRPGTLQVPAPAPAKRLLPAGPPRPQVVALAGALRVELPIAQDYVTAIGYHAAGDSIALDPVGRQANEGLLTRLVHRLFGGSRGGLRYYELPGGSGPATAVLDVGAGAGTDVYSPVDGTVVGLIPFVVNGKTFGAQIDIQPSGAPSLVVSVAHLRPDPALTVGSSVAATTSKLGSLLDLAAVERQGLARYTQDAGNHVSIQVRPAATPAVP
jgi:hypothetical protein